MFFSSSITSIRITRARNNVTTLETNRNATAKRYD
jgi:hypothetical protein